MENKIEIGSKTFAEMAKANPFGLVLIGAGKPYEEWLNGVAEILVKEGIASEPVFNEAFVLSDNVMGVSGRTDLVLVFNDAKTINIGKLAIWRITFGDCSWVDDFAQNCHSDYKSGFGFSDSDDEKFA